MTNFEIEVLVKARLNELDYNHVMGLQRRKHEVTIRLPQPSNVVKREETPKVTKPKDDFFMRLNTQTSTPIYMDDFA